jgi:hypothetical protein
LETGTSHFSRSSEARVGQRFRLPRSLARRNPVRCGRRRSWAMPTRVAPEFSVR